MTPSRLVHAPRLSDGPSARARQASGLAPLLLAVTTLVLVLAACGEADNSLAEVAQRGYLVVGLDASYPPFEVVAAGGEMEGLDVDLARMLAADMGLGVEFRNISFDGLYDALAAGQVDAIISALPPDPLRTEDVRYSSAYFDDGLVWIMPAAASGIEEAAEVVAVEMGSEAAALVSGQAGTLVLKQLLSEQEVIAAVAGGNADRGVVTRLSACLAIAAAPTISIGGEVTNAPYAIAVRADAASLADAIEASLSEIVVGPDWQVARARWLGEACR